MPGENATISIQQYGRRHVVVTKISLGLEMNVQDSNNGRFTRMFQTHKVTSGNLDVSLAFNSHAAHESFMKWLQGYVRRASDPDIATHPVRFIMPARRIDKLCVFMGGITFGDKVAQAVYPAELKFKEIGRRALLSEQERSVFHLPSSDDLALPYFYPSGTQLNGKALGKDYEHDTDYDAQPPPIRPGTPS